MKNDEIEELKILIPSEDVRNYALEKEWSFTDRQKAVLLIYSSLPLKEQYFHLRTMQRNTTDQRLQEQIAGYLNREERKFQAFKENNDKACIYILKVKDEDISYSEILPAEYFFELKLAYKCGKETDLPFAIEKHLVETREHIDQCGSVTASLEFDKDGKAVYLCSDIRDEEETEDFCEFFEVPNPFEKGDIVKLVGTEMYGIVATSQETWKEEMAKYENDERRQKHWDFSDIQIRVEFLCEDGTFGHDHVNPLYLERYRPEEDWDKSSPMDKLLLQASCVHRGKGSLEDLYIFTMQYRNIKEGKDRE